jgi:hypothetical protein
VDRDFSILVATNRLAASVSEGADIDPRHQRKARRDRSLDIGHAPSTSRELMLSSKSALMIAMIMFGACLPDRSMFTGETTEA